MTRSTMPVRCVERVEGLRGRKQSGRTPRSAPSVRDVCPGILHVLSVTSVANRDCTCEPSGEAASTGGREAKEMT